MFPPSCFMISVAIRHGPEYIVPMQKITNKRGSEWH